MRSAVLILLTILLSLYSYAQEIPVNTEQQLENLADTDQAETEDDSWKSYIVQVSCDNG